jgi:N-methylhydantoinase A/oxoprolinase/acetone carboxylase beta subunit
MSGARVAADVGGTFTDVVFQLPDGGVTVRKVLSTLPDYDRALGAGIGELVAEAGVVVEEVLHGTTVATNAVLEKRLLVRGLEMMTGYYKDPTHPAETIDADNVGVGGLVFYILAGLFPSTHIKVTFRTAGAA